MGGRVFKHRDFLRAAASSREAILTSTPSQLAMIVELFHNIEQLNFTKPQKEHLMKRLPLIHSIGKLRGPKKARAVIYEKAYPFISVIIAAALAQHGLSS